MSDGNTNKVRVFIADDHQIICEGLRTLIERDPGFVVSGEAHECTGLVDRIRESASQILVLDIGMKGNEQLQALEEVSHALPGVKTLVFSMYAYEHYASQAFKHGAWGYLMKECAPREMLAALACLASGRRYINESTASALANELYEHKAAPGNALSEREWQTFRLLARGMMIKDIAQEMGVSIKTVSTFRTRIFRKLKISSRPELISYARENGLAS